MSLYDLSDLLTEIYNDRTYLEDNPNTFGDKGKKFDDVIVFMYSGTDRVQIQFANKGHFSHKVSVYFSKSKYLSIVTDMDMNFNDMIKEQMKDFLGLPFNLD
jgi:hypothetical protein